MDEHHIDSIMEGITYSDALCVESADKPSRPPLAIPQEEHILWVRQTSNGPASHSSSCFDVMDLESEATITTQTSSSTTVDDVSSNSIVGLPDDLLAHTASFLNVGSLKQSRLVNRKFNRVLSQDEAGWKAHCERLWGQRLHVSPCMRQDMELLPAKDAYRLSCADARLRHSLRLEDIIFDPSRPNESTIWSFRFKQVAGAEWTNADPWYAGREARRLVFLADGSVRQLVFHTHSNTASSSSSSLSPNDYTLHPPFFESNAFATGLPISWRFVMQPIDFPKKEMGAYVRLTIAGRDVPTYIVHRSPLGNWGFIMENCWGVFASFPLPRKVMPVPTIHTPRMRLRRDTDGVARWLDVSQVESDDEEAEDNTGRNMRKRKNLLEDDSLVVTCSWQWREALLYNLGASILPDGPNASADFDRAWQLSMRSMQSFGFPAAARNNDPNDNVVHD